MGLVAVRRKAGGDVKRGNAAGHEIEHAGAGYAADHLRDDVAEGVLQGKAAARHEAGRHGGIQVAARDVPDSRRHRQHRQAEGQRHSDETDAEIGIGGRQHGAAAATQNKPERADRLGEQLTHDYSSRRMRTEITKVETYETRESPVNTKGCPEMPHSPASGMSPEPGEHASAMAEDGDTDHGRHHGAQEHRGAGHVERVANPWMTAGVERAGQ